MINGEVPTAAEAMDAFLINDRLELFLEYIFKKKMVKLEVKLFYDSIKENV